jgi:hypothetical protein
MAKGVWEAGVLHRPRKAGVRKSRKSKTRKEAKEKRSKRRHSRKHGTKRVRGMRRLILVMK